MGGENRRTTAGQLQANAENIPGHVLCLLVASLVASTSSNVPAAPLLRLRGGMVIHTLGEIKKEDERKAGAGMGSASMGQPVDGEKLSKDFMGMYHEKQIGGLCAVHCINNLLQVCPARCCLPPTATADEFPMRLSCASIGVCRAPNSTKSTSPRSLATWTGGSARHCRARGSRASRAMCEPTAFSACRSLSRRCSTVGFRAYQWAAAKLQA